MGLSQPNWEPRADWYRLARLLDVVHSEKKLYLVFEFLSQDLKKYMDSTPASELPLHRVKVPGEGRADQQGGHCLTSKSAPKTCLTSPCPPPLCQLLLSLARCSRVTSSSCCRG